MCFFYNHLLGVIFVGISFGTWFLDIYVSVFFVNVSGRGNVFLCSDPNIVVTAQDIDRVVGQLEQDGKFGDDNRAGFPDELHRVSVLRRKHVSAKRPVPLVRIAFV